MVIPIHSRFSFLYVRDEGPYAVRIENGRRPAAGFGSTAYRLFVPQPAPDLPPPPWPAVVYAHGFTRTFRQHGLNALYMASRGIIVLTPNLTTMFTWNRCVRSLAEAVGWLAQRGCTEGDALHGLLDSSRTGLTGHSLGAPVAFEAAILAKEKGYPLSSFCFLDGTPLPRTFRLAPKFPTIPFLNLRSEPGLYNFYGVSQKLTPLLPGPATDMLVPGSRHCDAENPTTLRAPLILAHGGNEYRREFMERLGAFFCDWLYWPF